MTDGNYIKYLMANRGLTVADLAKEIGISACSCSRKLSKNSSTEFTVAEAQKMYKVLKMDEHDVMKAFFTKKNSSVA